MLAEVCRSLGNIPFKFRYTEIPYKSRRHLNPLHPLRLRNTLPDRVGLMHWRVGFPLDEVAVAGFGAHIALVPGDLAA